MNYKILSFVVALTFFMSCSNSSTDANDATATIADNQITAQNPDVKNPEPVMTFEHETWDFGKINEGEEVRHIFKFTNTGDEDLVIRNAQASCGCTVPRWERKPIRPGETSEIEVKFNSSGKPGNQSKNVTITANTNPPETILSFKAVVLPNE